MPYIAKTPWGQTRYIQPQNPPSDKLPRLPGRLTGFPHQRSLARDTDRIQDVEHVVPQPRHESRDGAPQVEDEVAVPNDLRGGPRDEHAAVERGGGSRGRELVDDGPDKENARGDLQDRRREGGADEAWIEKSVQPL